MDKRYTYTTDGKVRHYSKDEEVNGKLGRIIGTKFIEYRKLWDAVNRFELVTEFPLFLHIDMNQRCNLRCPHCISGNPKLIEKYYTKETLGWGDYKNIVDEGADYKCPSITPQGNNEPLLIKDLEKYIQYAKKCGFIDIMINTNATLLTEERSRKLLDSGLTRIRFSIDAVRPETYAKVRVGGDYYKVMTNIERFLNLKKSLGYSLPIVGVSFCKISINERELDAFLKYWEDKVDIVTVQTFIPPVLEEDFSRYYPSDQTGREEEVIHFRCPQPFQRVVMRNRDITPCCATFGSKLKIGEIGLNSIHEVWNSQSMKEMRDLHRNGEYFKNAICKKCVDLVYPKNIKRT